MAGLARQSCFRTRHVYTWADIAPVEHATDVGANEIALNLHCRRTATISTPAPPKRLIAKPRIVLVSGLLSA